MTNYSVDRNKWAKLSIFQQMGNISSEVGRSLAAKRRGDQVAAESAVVRALDLFSATTDAWLVSYPARTKELLRAKEQYLDAFTSNTGENGIESYFMNFAIASRLSKG